MTASPTRATDGLQPPYAGDGTTPVTRTELFSASDGGLTPVTGVARRQTPPRRSRLGRALTAGLIIFGAALFVAGRLGAATGWMYTSFDPHHVISQIGGAVLFLAGLMRLR